MIKPPKKLLVDKRGDYGLWKKLNWASTCLNRLEKKRIETKEKTEFKLQGSTHTYWVWSISVYTLYMWLGVSPKKICWQLLIEPIELTGGDHFAYSLEVMFTHRPTVQLAQLPGASGHAVVESKASIACTVISQSVHGDIPHWSPLGSSVKPETQWSRPVRICVTAMAGRGAEQQVGRAGRLLPNLGPHGEA